MTTVLQAEEAFCRWTVISGNELSFEDARRYSLPGNELPGGQPLAFTDNMVDLGKLFPGFVPAESKAVVRGVFNVPAGGRMVISVGADWWFHGFINGVPFGDTEADGNNSHPISAFDQFYTVDLKEGENVVTFHLRAGNNWHFGAMLLPIPSSLPGNYRVIQRIAEALLENDFKMEREPLVFNLSTTHAYVVTEFSIPALCGIRFAPENGGEPVTVWNKIYGQREKKQIHLFALTGLNAGTVYNYEILFQDEKAGAEKVIYTGKFTTFPAEAAEHRFTVFSDVQLPTAGKRQAITDFTANSGVKQADFIIALGDMASGFGNFAKEYFTDFSDLLRQLGAPQPIAFIRGNHELWGAESQLYSAFLGRPYGAFTYGDTFYILLDSGDDQPPSLSPQSKTQRSDTAEYFAEEAAWLAEVVNSPECRNAKRRIVLAHGTPFECNNRYMAGNLREMVGKLFYGENPVCKIDLWIAGHIHYMLRYDPVAGKLYGNRHQPIALTENDIRDIRFPVYTNDGPGGRVKLSVLDIICRDGKIQLRATLPDGKVADEIIITPGRPFEVVQSDFNLLWEK